MKSLLKNTKIDWYIPILTVILALLGLLFIWSASTYSALKNYSDPLFFVKKQALAFAVGIVCMSVVASINLGFLKKYKWVCLAVGYILLALVFIPGLGVESYGAKRWINLYVFSMQPSEVSKFLLMIFLAGFMDKYPIDKPLNFAVGLFLGGAMCLLIMLEPNMSVTVCLLLSVLIMLCVGGAKIKYFIILSIPLLVAFVLLIALEPYRMKRIAAFIDPWSSPKGEGYQLIQSLYALSRGGWFGVGIGNSGQKYLFLPFAESDFILSVIGEETGLVGVILLMSIYLLLIIRGFKAAKNAGTRFDCYLASGITAVLTCQTLINLAVVSGSIPPTGIPLPFISFGGSSLVAFMTASGILINVSKTRAINIS